MKLPKSVKLGRITYTVHTTEEKLLDLVKSIDEDVHTENDGGYLFGYCNYVEKEIWISLKTDNGKDLTPETIESTFYHECAHAILFEMAFEGHNDEMLVNYMGEKLLDFVTSINKA